MLYSSPRTPRDRVGLLERSDRRVVLGQVEVRVALVVQHACALVGVLVGKAWRGRCHHNGYERREQYPVQRPRTDHGVSLNGSIVPSSSVGAVGFVRFGRRFRSGAGAAGTAALSCMTGELGAGAGGSVGAGAGVGVAAGAASVLPPALASLSAARTARGVGDLVAGSRLPRSTQVVPAATTVTSAAITDDGDSTAAAVEQRPSSSSRTRIPPQPLLRR